MTADEQGESPHWRMPWVEDTTEKPEIKPENPESRIPNDKAEGDIVHT